MMNKFWKKIAVLALTGTMTLGMSVNALAADNGKDTDSKLTTNNTGADSDTGTINLIKHYILGTATASGIQSPAEDFIFTITPYGVWNAGSSTGDANGGAYSVDTMPAFAKESMRVTLDDKTKTNVVTIHADLKQAGSSTDASTSITLSEYNSVGDFWYKVEETNSKTTGVFYGTNSVAEVGDNISSENGTYSRVYYIHVQVVNNPDYDSTKLESKKFLRSVTMHKTAPIKKGMLPATNVEYNTWATNNYSSEAKVNDIQNTYYAGDLVIKKNVTGNAGDKDEYFPVTVTFTKPNGTIINSDIRFIAVAKNGYIYRSKTFVIKGQYYTQSGNNYIIPWVGSGGNIDEKTATCTFYVKDNSTVTFSNIPYGINYTIKEELPENDTYKQKCELIKTGTDETADPTKFDDVTLNNDASRVTELTARPTTGDTNVLMAEGSITDVHDEYTITNDKVTNIDIGVVTTNAPYIAILILAAAALVLFVHRRKTMIEE